MRRADLEHVIRAAAAISGEHEFVVLGTSSLLASVPAPPAPLERTRDVDLYPLRAPELAAVIDGSIGELSTFHEHFSYYAQGVGPETSILPQGWQSRLVKIQNPNTNDAIAYCLEPHDLAASKLAAHRDKDLSFVATMLSHKIIDPVTLADRIDHLPWPPDRTRQLRTWLSDTVAAPTSPRSRDADRDVPDI
ncbi:MAG TPA: DUF6036 family nucleotidyltransferase [Anaeromyxobacteraceae bacterium]|nr:DUF6036 family nucleotidyltransferase [Anaeromyxobacteraceae bacterium]